MLHIQNLPSSLSLLFLFVFALFPCSRLAAAASCPVAEENLRSLSSNELESLCMAPVRGYHLKQQTGKIAEAIQQCRNALRLSQETGRVVSAIRGRRENIAPPVSSFEEGRKSPQLLFGLHAYANISFTALYRELLKVKQSQGKGAQTLDALNSLLAHLRGNLSGLVKSQAAAKAAGDNARVNYLRYSVIPPVVNDLLTAEESGRLVENTGACLESAFLRLSDSFESWKALKGELLGYDFAALSAGGNAENTASLRQLQADQQYVYDVLTDAAKRDWAYKLAETCFDNSCGTWSILGTITGFVTGTSGVSLIAKIITGGLAADLARRQGLDFWQQIREGGNSATPFNLGLFDTEIKRIERGEAAPFPVNAG
jgi:hypothetical protein